MNKLDSAASSTPIRVLVVDDHPSTASTLARAIAQLGPQVDVLFATSGSQALELIKDSSTDILITDMIMPEMTGLELIEKLQNHPAGRPTFTYLVTAFDVPGLRMTAHRLKVNDIIIKPVRPERICEITSQALQAMSQTRPSSKAFGTQRAFKILIADDQPDNIALLARYLKNEGYDFITAADGIEAVNKARDEQPDLVLLDINMPHQDGLSALEEIRSDPSIDFIPVIILTAARLDAADVQSGLNLGADDYVTKPFDRRELMARIRTKLRVKEANDALRRRNREFNLVAEIGRDLSGRLNIEDLTNVLLKRTVETLGAILGHILMLNRDGTFQSVLHFPTSVLASATADQQYPLFESLLKSTRQDQQTFIIKDTHQDPRWHNLPDDPTHSAVIVPLLGRHDLLGLLVLTHEQEQYFTLDHALMLQAIASQAAIAMENYRLYADVVQQQRRLAAVLQSAQQAILIFEPDGCLGLLNPSAQILFADWQLQLGQKLPANPGTTALIALLEKARAAGGLKTSEIILPGQRSFAAQITPIEGCGQLLILQDITHFKTLEKVKNEFIASASHDLKNPLTSIAGYIQLLPQAGPLNEMQTDFAHRIEHASRNMTELVQNMLDLAKIDINSDVEIKRESVDINLLLAELADEFLPQAQAKGQTLSFEKLEDELCIQADAFQLQQAFRNLIGNAIKYTPQGGAIRLIAKLGQGNLQVVVQDTGFGIPAANLPYVFDRFYRVREGKSAEIEGNGLGLAIVKSIVEQHGGMVSAESEPGHGTCFNVTLPISDIPQFAAAEKV